MIRRRPGGLLGAPAVIVGDDDLLKGVALRRNAGKRTPDPPGPDYQHLHSHCLPRELPLTLTLSAERAW